MIELAGSKLKINQFIKTIFSKYFLLIASLIVAFAFGLVQPKFFRPENLLDILRSSAVLAITAMGLVFVMAAGELDFAAGSELSMGAVFCGFLMNIPGFNYIVAIILTVVFMSFIGYINSVLSIKVGMPSFVATMGTSAVLVGICKYLTNGGHYHSVNWPKSFTFIGQSFIAGIIPFPVIVILSIATLAHIFMSMTRKGKYVYSVGSNPEASSHVGINVHKTKMLSFIICSVFCGLAGILQSSTINATSATLGSETLMGAMSALMLGATFLRPGVFNILGACVGAILLSIIQNGLVMVGATYYMKDVVQGIILIISVGIIAVIRKGFKISFM